MTDSRKFQTPLTPDMRADATVRHVLLHLLESMLANEKGAVTGDDLECLHDFRIALRRTRSTLAQMKSVFPPNTLARFRDEFAWLGSVTSPARDLDVYLLNFKGYRRRLPKELRKGLRPLHDLLIREHVQAHDALNTALTGQHYRKLKMQWRRYLDRPLAKRPSAPDANAPIAEVARRRTWRVYKQIRREGKRITPDSAPAELHQLRKSCKKLRYLMELFRDLYASKEIKRLTKELKKLQDNLGKYQDLHVQIETLERYRPRLQDQGPDPILVRRALAALIQGLSDGMQHQREAFDGNFQQFTRQANHSRFLSLFNPRQ